MRESRDSDTIRSMLAFACWFVPVLYELSHVVAFFREQPYLK
jgi:hypothetical protein